MQKKNYWSPEMVKDLAGYLGAGLTYEEIGAFMGLSPRAVEGAKYRYLGGKNVGPSRKGVKVNFWSDSDLEELVRLYSDKRNSVEFVAKSLGRSVRATQQKAFSIGIKRL